MTLSNLLNRMIDRPQLYNLREKDAAAYRWRSYSGPRRRYLSGGFSQWLEGRPKYARAREALMDFYAEQIQAYFLSAIGVKQSPTK